jgi:hypothetical protein
MVIVMGRNLAPSSRMKMAVELSVPPTSREAGAERVVIAPVVEAMSASAGLTNVRLNPHTKAKHPTDPLSEPGSLPIFPCSVMSKPTRSTIPDNWGESSKKLRKIDALPGHRPAIEYLKTST